MSIRECMILSVGNMMLVKGKPVCSFVHAHSVVVAAFNWYD